MYYMSKDTSISARLPAALIEAVDEMRQANATRSKLPALSRSQVVEVALLQWIEDCVDGQPDDVNERIARRLGL